MTDRNIKVGIVGLQPGRSWAARAHVPALRSLTHAFEIVGVANTSLESARAAATATGIPTAFPGVAAMVASPGIDVVVVTVRVAHHAEIVRQAIAAGKHVYCEWPLGNGLAEAEELASLALAKGVLGVVGTQARVAPEIQYLQALIADGFIGDVLSTTLVARGAGWGGVIPDKENNAYMLDKAGGATMLTIPVGHTLAAVTSVLGAIADISSVLATRRKTAIVAGTDETVPVNAPDQVLVSGVLASGAPIAIHYRGGMPRGGDGLVWEINGSRGDIRVTAPFGHAQLAPLALFGAHDDEKELRALPVPASFRGDFPGEAAVGNVARNYARMVADLRSGSRTAPRFEDAVALHRLIDAIERADDDGRRTPAARRDSGSSRQS